MEPSPGHPGHAWSSTSPFLARRADALPAPFVLLALRGEGILRTRFGDWATQPMLAHAPDQAMELWGKLWQDGTELTYLCERIGLAHLTNELIDNLLADYKTPEDLIGENGLLKQITKRLVERALQAEMTQHLGHAKNDCVANPAGNTRNGKSRKTLKGDFDELSIEIPRDRHASFEPQIVTKHQTRWAGFDDKILSLYARGMTVREIQSHLEEMYGAEVSPTLISSITDAVMDEAKAWQSRPLDALYPIVYLDCIHVKTRDAGAVRAKAVYLALGISMTG